jgi:hypothetical protein
MSKKRPRLSQYRRTFEQIDEVCLFPRDGGVGVNLSSEDQRHEAVAEVLRRLPNAPYQKLTRLIDDFLWFIPHEQMGGWTQPFPMTHKGKLDAKLAFKPGDSAKAATYAKVIYLSPRLERTKFTVVVAIVAHELAHEVLGHSVLGVQEQEYKRQEAQAWTTARRWGFTSETRNWHKWVREGRFLAKG